MRTPWLLPLLTLLAACDAEPETPTAPAPPAPPPAAARTVAAEGAPFRGRFESKRLVLELDPTLRGTLSMGRRGPFPATATVAEGTLQGEFEAEGKRYPFSARSEDDGLILTADGRDYPLRRASTRSAEAGDVEPGTYGGSLNGLPATLTLRTSGEALEGEATTSDGYRYTVRARRTADGVRGSFGDPQSGRTLPLRLVGSPAGVELSVSAPGKPPAKVLFRRDRAGPRETAPARDTALVGIWIQGELDGGLERATLQLNADGTYLYGTSRAREGDSGARSEAGQGQVIQGIWRTEAGVLYTRPAGLETWIHYAGYAEEGNKLELTFEDERVEAWLRKG